MFASLAKYKTQSYYDRFRPWNCIRSGDYTVELFAGRVIDGNDEAAYSGFTDWAESSGRVDSLKAVSTFRAIQW